VSHIVIRRTNLYRIGALRAATISRLEPGDDEVFLFSSLSGPLSIHVGDAMARVPARGLVVVHEPRMHLLSESETDVIIAVSQASVIRELNLQVSARTGGITQVRTSSILGTSLDLALMRAFDASDASGGYLDPRVIDVIHMMSRSIIQLPVDVETPGRGAVTTLERARTLIAEMHLDPSTTPDSIATALGVPLRTLQRAFSRADSSIALELRRARASTAAALLSSPSAHRYTAARSARDAGFGSVASMRRALREFAQADDANTATSSDSGAPSVLPAAPNR
jgi:AraC-like DNA-binding protein